MKPRVGALFVLPNMCGVVLVMGFHMSVLNMEIMDVFYHAVGDGKFYRSDTAVEWEEWKKWTLLCD